MLGRFGRTASDARKVSNAMLSEMDDAVGRVQQALRSRDGMEARTVWLFNSDNGGAREPWAVGRGP